VTALEFLASLKADNTLNVPADVASQLRNAGEVRVLVLLPQPGDDQDIEWRRLGMARFLTGYAESDSIYDDL
jgi:hypothetical protein